MRNFNRTWRLIKQRRVGVPMIGTAVNLGMLGAGYFTFGSIGLVLQQLADKMVGTVVDDSRAKLVNIFRPGISGSAALAFVVPMAALTLMDSHFRRAMGLYGPSA